MTYNESLTNDRIRIRIIYNSIIFLIFLFWFSYYTFEDVSILILLSLVTFLVILAKFMIDRKYGFTEKELVVYILLFLIPFYLYINIILFINDLPAFFIPFYNLVGIKHNHNLILFLLYFSLILIKLIGIKIYFVKNIKIIKRGSGDEIFKYFTRNLTYKRVLLLIIFFSLAAFVEELVYRSFLLSIFIYYFNWDSILSIIVISVIFGLVHYSTSKNWSHVISTLISSIIYSFALIYLGLLYPWIFHLATNLFVLLFYHQAFKKNFHGEVKN